MKLTPKSICVAAICTTILLLSTHSYGANPEPHIIPAVQQWTGGEGVCALDAQSILISGNDNAVLQVAKAFQEDIKHVTGKDYKIELQKNATDQSNPGGIVLKLSNKISAKEGYVIETDRNVLVTASTPNGLFYATQSILQMMTLNSKLLPKGKIVDAPDYRVRSLMFDVGRKFVPYEQLKDWVRAMSYVKMNQFHLHLNDSIAMSPGFRLEMKTLPGLANKDGHYTQEQMKDLQAFAKVRGVAVVPEIDAPAHSTAFTAYRPDLIHPKLASQNLDLTNPGTIKLMEKVFDEICDVFESKHIHIGTDELRLGKMRDKKEKEQMGELFRGYINHFNDYLAKKGRITRIWSGYEHMPGKTQPKKDVVIDMWVTNDAAQKVKEGYSFINSNHSWTYIVPCTSIYGINNKNIYQKWAPNYFSSKPGGIIPKDTPNLLGGKFHIWNDNGYQHAGFSNNEIARIAMSSLLVFSEKLWGRKGSDDFEAFQHRARTILPGENGFEFTSGSKSRHDAKNPLLGHFPGTTFLKRKVTSDAKGVVWKLPKANNFVEATTYPLNLTGGPDHLTYPWTAEFEITRYSDTGISWNKAPHAHEVLMDSKLCTMYLDYTYFDKYDKKTNLPTIRNQGLCLVRAARSPAATPEQHINRQVAFFDYKVPVGEKVKLKLVGEKGYTELYVNGVLHKRVNQQCVCPLKSLGASAWDSSFHGKLDHAVIYNKALTK